MKQGGKDKRTGILQPGKSGLLKKCPPLLNMRVWAGVQSYCITNTGKRG